MADTASAARRTGRCQSPTGHISFLQPLHFAPVSRVWLLLPSRSSAETQCFQASSAYVPAWERDGQPPGVCMMLGTLDTGKTKEHFMVASRGPGLLWNL